MNNLDDIITWDQVNWKKALDYWEKHTNFNTNGKALELGGNEGGLSLWLALKGMQVVCSDLESPEDTAKPIHQKHKLDSPITYQAINATDIPYENELDVIAFKSIVGGIARNGNDKVKKDVVEAIHKALKPEGTLLFAENLAASGLHRFFRKRFIKWGSQWNYLRLDEIAEVFSSFDSVNYTTVGFFGAFGRSEKQRRFLGRIDSVFEKLLPARMKYIVIGVARK